MTSGRFASLTAALAAGALLSTCAPAQRGPAAPTQAGAGADQACQNAVAAEASVSRKTIEYEALRSQITEREARLIELQRLRSRIVTGRMSDDELAIWERAEEQQPAVDTTAADTAHAATVAPTPAGMDTVQAAVGDTAQTAGTIAPQAAPGDGVVAPSDTTQTRAPIVAPSSESTPERGEQAGEEIPSAPAGGTENGPQPDVAP